MMALVNTMGNEVAEGYTCRPKNFDANRPIMHFKTQVFICDDERCGGIQTERDLSKELRDLLKEMGLEKGEKRIKITRTNCFGACRFRQSCEIVENTRANGTLINNGIWLKGVHRFKLERWREIFEALRDDVDLNTLLEEKHFIPMKEY